MKFVPKTKTTEERTLTPREIKNYSAQLANDIVVYVQAAVREWFADPVPPVSPADGMQVAMTGMAVAEGILTNEALKTGLPIERLREIHDKLVVEMINRRPR